MVSLKQKKKQVSQIFYLGVDDGQFGKIIAHEIPSIRQAFNSNNLTSSFFLEFI